MNKAFDRKGRDIRVLFLPLALLAIVITGHYPYNFLPSGQTKDVHVSLAELAKIQDLNIEDSSYNAQGHQTPVIAAIDIHDRSEIKLYPNESMSAGIELGSKPKASAKTLFKLVIHQ